MLTAKQQRASGHTEPRTGRMHCETSAEKMSLIGKYWLNVINKDTIFEC